MLKLVWRRSLKGAAPLGRWTAAYFVAIFSTFGLVISAIAPKTVDTERYWHAWLGNTILRDHAVPTALGPESPLSAGSPWVVQQWLYALVVSEARFHHLFVVLAILLALGFSSLVWFALGECIRGRVNPGVTTLVVLLVGLVAIFRFDVRAEDIAIAMTLGCYLLVRSRPAWLCALALPPVFLLWANIHASFPMGIALCLVGIVQSKRFANLSALAAAIVVTLVNPSGLDLWHYIAWLPHSWIKYEIPEWRPAFDVAPFFVAPLFLPLMILVKRVGRRRYALPNILIWVALTAVALDAARFMPIAVAVGLPAGCAAYRSRFTIGRLWGGVGTAAFTLAFVFAIGRFDFVAHGIVVDPAFGLVVAADSAQALLPDADSKGRLTLCASGGTCDVALYYGALTVFDGRTDPFPKKDAYAFFNFFVDQKDPIRSQVGRIISDSLLRVPPPVPAGFTLTSHFGRLRIYDRKGAVPVSSLSSRESTAYPWDMDDSYVANTQHVIRASQP